MSSLSAKRSGVAVLVTTLFLLSGCWNADVSNVSLGDVSVGQQLLDLQAAHESGAIDDSEYEQARQKLLSLLDGCDCSDAGDSESENDNEVQGAD